MTTKQTIAYLKPLRADVSKAHTRVLDLLATGAPADRTQGFFDLWREAVRTYLDALANADTNSGQLTTMIAELNDRLETGFSMEYPENGAEAWKVDKHFEKLLAELEVCTDLVAGHQATRLWLLTQDARLRQTIRRTTRSRPPVPSSESEPLEVMT